MRPKNQNRRLALIAVFGLLLIIGSWLVLSALKKSSQFFYNPSEILADTFVAQSAQIKIGGLVVPRSIEKDDEITTRFLIVDFPEAAGDLVDYEKSIRVEYEGVLPDLFAEGDGVVVTGVLIESNFLKADDVLAKHDENYQPVK